MKIKYGDFRGHENAVKMRNTQIKKNTRYGEIIACLVIFDEVKKSWYVPRENKPDECILANGYRWLQIYGIEKNSVISVVFDEENRFVETYFDIAKEIYMNEDIPYAKDLYLDVVQTKENYFIIIDQDELDEALETNDITIEDYNLAEDVAKKIVKKYQPNDKFNELNNFSKRCLEECLNKIES